MSWRPRGSARRMPALVLVLGLVCLSCGADGGPVGTGSSATSAISGNVVGVETDAGATSGAAAGPARSALTRGRGSGRSTGSAQLPGPLPRIEVSIDGLPNLTTTADSGGNFTLSGDFAGSVTMRFRVPQYQVTQLLDVPAGSTVVLQDIELQPGGVVAQAARQLDFVGLVDLVDCSDGTLLVHERRSGGMQFLVHLDGQTSFVDGAGNTRSCADIPVGSTVEVEGAIAYATDRTITALVVTLAPPPQLPPPAQFAARFSGAIAALDCSTGYVVVDDTMQRSRVQLTAQTQITTAAGRVTCQDLRLGDQVRGVGQINRRMAGIIVAQQLTVTGPADAQQPLRFVGFVNSVDCSTGLLQIGDITNTVAVQLLPATVITGMGHRVLLCTDIAPGDRVAGLGRVAAQVPGTLDALQVNVQHVHFE
jgi:hypothetical protein